MKELHFKKWVSTLLKIIAFISLMLLCTVEFESTFKQLIFMLVNITIMFTNTILLLIYE